MSLEHAPRPGAHWGTRVERVEQVVPGTTDAGHSDPQPRPNRAARRAEARANRRSPRRG